MRYLHLTLIALCASLASGCGDNEQTQDHEAGSGHTAHTGSEGGEDPHAEAGHSHTAPRGGLLVVLSEELAHAELLLDAEAGRIDAHLLGPHAEMPMRSPQPTLLLELRNGSETLQLELAAQESALSGDRLGACSHFSVDDPRLVGLKDLSGEIGEVRVLGRRFAPVRFSGEDSK